MNFLVALNFLGEILILRNEIENKRLVRGEFLFRSSSKIISRAIIRKLEEVLSDKVAFVVSPKTKSIFHEEVREYKGDMVLIRRSPTGLEYSPIYLRDDLMIPDKLDKDLIYFFVDKEDGKLAYPFSGQDLKYVIYEKSLNYTEGKEVVDEFIRMYKKEEPASCSYKGTDLVVRYTREYKEVILRNPHIGTIHSTSYFSHNDLYEEVKDHFLSFYSGVTQPEAFVGISERYIDSLLTLMEAKGILKKGSRDLPGVVEALFPFKFYKDLSEIYKSHNLITGGISLEKVNQDPFLKGQVPGKGTLFIISGVVRERDGSLYVELL